MDIYIKNRNNNLIYLSDYKVNKQSFKISLTFFHSNFSISNCI